MSKLKNSVQRFNNKPDQGKEKKKKRTNKLEERSVESIQLKNKKRMKRIWKAVGTMHTIKRNNVLNGATGEVKEKTNNG